MSSIGRHLSADSRPGLPVGSPNRPLLPTDGPVENTRFRVGDKSSAGAESVRR